MLATRPTLTGSLQFANAIGIVVVAVLAARATPAVPIATRTVTGRRTRSNASERRPSYWPVAAKRLSMTAFWPSANPCSLNPLRKLANCFAFNSGDPIPRTPITGIVGCCARAAIGHAGATAEQRDELTPFHSITSSVRASSDTGISRPSAAAVFRLMINSNLVANCTGSSAGFSPLRIRST